MKKYAILLGCLFATPLYANVVFPFMVMIAKANHAISFYFLIIASLIVEFIVFSFLLPKESRYKIAVATIAMNIASALIGVVAQVFGDLGLLSFGQLLISKEASKEAPLELQQLLYRLWFVVYTTLINTVVEFFVAWVFFGKINARLLLFYIFLINALSVFLGVGGVIVYELFYGKIKLAF